MLYLKTILVIEEKLGTLVTINKNSILSYLYWQLFIHKTRIVSNWRSVPSIEGGTRHVSHPTSDKWCFES